MSKLNSIILTLALICSITCAKEKDFEIEFETGDEAPILDKFAQYFDSADEQEEYMDIDFNDLAALFANEKGFELGDMKNLFHSDDEEEARLNELLEKLQQELGELESIQEETYQSSYDGDVDYELNSYVANYENEDYIVDKDFKTFTEKLCKNSYI
jgi:hypothetical protein